MRQGGRHLRQTEAEADIHKADDHAGDQQSAETTGCQAEIPAGEMAGDHRADAKGPEGPDAGLAPQRAIFEILLADGFVFDAFV